MAVTTYKDQVAPQREVEDELKNQAASTGCCPSILGADADEVDEFEVDGPAFKIKTRKENKIQFFKVWYTYKTVFYSNLQ